MSSSFFSMRGHTFLRRELPGFSVLLLPAEAYEARYVPDRHTIGFTLAPQQGIHAFGCDARRPFHAEPWRLAFTPAGCDVFSASDQGGEYLLLSVEREKFAEVTERLPPQPLAQITNVVEPGFTRLALTLRRAMLAAANTADLAIEEIGITGIELAATRLAGVVQRGRDRLGAARLRQIMRYLDANLAGEVRLADLARELRLSEAYLARAFQSATGTTLHSALMDRRIARARALMTRSGGTHWSLARIAAESGFASHAHMATVFQRVLGLTPSQWRGIAVQSGSPSRRRREI